MARIRSIHPEQWNDEEFCSLSMPARLLALGLRNFCDDNGAFEWKPLRLKMRVFPADNIDVAPLLEELEHANLVRRYSIDGQVFGLVRNFRKFQRPKKPSGSYPEPVSWSSDSELVRYSGCHVNGSVPDWYGTSSEPVPNRYGNSSAEGEKSREEKIKAKEDRPSVSEKPKEQKRSVTLRQYLDDCDARRIDPIPENDPVLRYAQRINLPDEFVSLAWTRFQRVYLGEKTRQSKWPQKFRNAVEGNWYKLWFESPEGWKLTTAGIQEKRNAEAIDAAV